MLSVYTVNKWETESQDLNVKIRDEIRRPRLWDVWCKTNGSKRDNPRRWSSWSLKFRPTPPSLNGEGHREIPSRNRRTPRTLVVRCYEVSGGWLSSRRNTVVDLCQTLKQVVNLLVQLTEEEGSLWSAGNQEESPDLRSKYSERRLESLWSWSARCGTNVQTQTQSDLEGSFKKQKEKKGC